MTLRVASGFDAAAWHRLLPAEPATPLHDPAWLTVMCSRLPGELVTVTRGAELGFCGAIVSDPQAYEAYNPHALLWRDPPVFELANERQRRDALAGLNVSVRTTLPALVLVAPGYCGDPAGSSAGDPTAIASFLSAALRWCEQRGLAGLHILYSGTDAVSKAVADLGGASYPVTSRYLLPVRWDDWQGYLRGLPARRAREVSRQLRRAAQAGVTPARLDPDSEFDAILHGRCALLRRYGQDADVDAERRRLRGLIEAFGNRLTAYGAMQAGNVVACAVGLRSGRSMNVIFSGATDAGHRLPYAHFLATYYAPVIHHTRGDLAEIDYGIGHGAGKVLRGCVARQLYGHAFGVGAERHRAQAEAAGLLADGVEEVTLRWR